MFLVVLVQWTLSCVSINVRYDQCVGKIQGDGRKFLDRFTTKLFSVTNIITIIK